MRYNMHLFISVLATATGTKTRARLPTRADHASWVFVVGGVTFSEMRCASEVTAVPKNWEVLVG